MSRSCRLATGLVYGAIRYIERRGKQGERKVIQRLLCVLLVSISGSLCAQSAAAQQDTGSAIDFDADDLVDDGVNVLNDFPAGVDFNIADPDENILFDEESQSTGLLYVHDAIAESGSIPEDSEYEDSLSPDDNFGEFGDGEAILGQDLKSAQETPEKSVDQDASSASEEIVADARSPYPPLEPPTSREKETSSRRLFPDAQSTAEVSSANPETPVRVEVDPAKYVESDSSNAAQQGFVVGSAAPGAPFSGQFDASDSNGLIFGGLEWSIYGPGGAKVEGYRSNQLIVSLYSGQSHRVVVKKISTDETAELTFTPSGEGFIFTRGLRFP